MSYGCGYGICRDGFTIETVELGRLEKKTDVEMFLKEKHYDELQRDRIYFYDDPDRECRMFYNRNSNEFTNDIRGLTVDGYIVTADFINEYDDDRETDTEETRCMSHARAQKLRDEYYNYGADAVGIDEEEISITNFWNADEFSKYVPEQKHQNINITQVVSFIKDTRHFMKLMGEDKHGGIVCLFRGSRDTCLEYSKLMSSFERSNYINIGICEDDGKTVREWLRINDEEVSASDSYALCYDIDMTGFEATSGSVSEAYDYDEMSL